MTNDMKLSIFRSLLKIGGSALVTFGVADAGSIDIVTTAITTILGAGLTAWGVISSWNWHKE